MVGWAIICYIIKTSVTKFREMATEKKFFIYCHSNIREMDVQGRFKKTANTLEPEIRI